MYEKELTIQEIKFNYFLNKTIIGASKDYYNKQQKIALRELLLIDNQDYSDYLKEYVKVENTLDAPEDVSALYELIDSESMLNAVKSLTDIERLVIFLLVIQGYTVTEVSKMLDMYIESISRIKARALKKLKNYLEGNWFIMENIYELGKKAKAGDEVALIKIIDIKRNLIEKMTHGDEDKYQYILEKLIIRNKKL